MGNKPVIGITVECKRDPNSRSDGLLTLGWNYAEAIAEAGGVPIAIPPTADPEAIAEIIDGWLIPGGLDIDAARFGEENHSKVELQDPARFESERALLEAIDPALPVLGICYGCQFLNVARGGTLEQHLPDRVGADVHSGGTLETLELDPGSRLAAAVQTSSIEGKSYHHQAIARPGQGLRVVARHEDGTTEAIEATDRPWLVGVQWHPERTRHDPATRRLFISFVRAAADFRARKRFGAAGA